MYVFAFLHNSVKTERVGYFLHNSVKTESVGYFLHNTMGVDPVLNTRLYVCVFVEIFFFF